MVSGVSLADGCAGIAVGPCVYHETALWCITGHVPIGPKLLEVDVVDRPLPGLLGRYVYPKDAVFTLRGRTVTHYCDLRELEAAEHDRAPDERDEVVQHLTIEGVDDGLDEGLDNAEYDEDDDEELSSASGGDDDDEEGGEDESEAEWSEDDG